MRKVLAIALFLLFSTAYTVAQDYPKVEVFGGLSFAHLDTEGATVPEGAPAGTSIKHWYPGWEAAVQYNLTKLLGIKADFGGNYGKPANVPGVTGIPSAHSYNFLFGPVVSARTGRFTPFAQALFGANRISIGSSTISVPVFGESIPETGYSETAFAMAFGGGLDMKVSHHFAVRLGQFDYLYTKHCLAVAGVCSLGVDGAPAAHQNNFRFSTGIVIH